MRKKALPDPDSRMHVLCPYCGHKVYRLSDVYQFCGGCQVEYTRSQSGNLWFDTTLNQYPFAKAAVKLGGISMKGEK